MSIKDLIELSGLTTKGFAEYLEIPLRTVEEWKANRRKCNTYIIKLIQYKLVKEGIIKED